MLIAVCVAALILFISFLLVWKIFHALLRWVGATLAAVALGAAWWFYGEEILQAVLPWVAS